MRNLLCLPAILLSFFLHAQTYEQVKKRFDNYLNYKGGLDKYVEITPEQIVLYAYRNGKKEPELILKKNEWAAMALLCKDLSDDSLVKVYEKKKKEGSAYLLHGNLKLEQLCHADGQPLCQKRIIIDPGHMAGNMQMARIEQKFLHFTKENYPALKQDSVDIAEGVLTFQTASILKKMLEEKGATVTLTRKENGTTFGCNYDEWLKNRKKKILDSLLAIKKISAARHKQLMSMNKAKFFLEFFKDFELLQRSRVINAAAADLVVIIHYNVNEKNTDWQKPTNKDLCMAFMPGCLIGDNLETTMGKINFLRLLLTTDAEQSEKVCSLLVNELNKQLEVPIAKTSDATYLEEHCTATSSPGVFCRNLALCRLVKGPLMYGECLYQDNETECYALLQNTETVQGVTTNKRVVLAAQAFLNAVLRYYAK